MRFAEGEEEAARGEAGKKPTKGKGTGREAEEEQAETADPL